MPLVILASSYIRLPSLPDILGQPLVTAGAEEDDVTTESLSDALGGPDGYPLAAFYEPESTEPEPATTPAAVLPTTTKKTDTTAARVARPAGAKVTYARHEVRSGESLWTISRKYGVDIDSIHSASGIKSGAKIQPGQKLRVPDRKGILHIVRRNDTIEDIALRYKVPIKEILAANGVGDPNRIRIKQELFLPNATPPSASARSRSRGTSYVTPAKGRLSGRFGQWKQPVSGRRTMHAGIDIAGGSGGAILAARGGRVTYAGRMGTYGKLVVIDHGNGTTTRYGHCSRILVRKGQRVNQRQKIALAGATGRVTGPHLHFEVRRNGTAIDPLTVLPKR
ncbi:MAG: peptidoglycan DD-metalloendopeptidase family protein [Candidatus Poribacteria bacterium]